MANNETSPNQSGDETNQRPQQPIEMANMSAPNPSWTMLQSSHESTSEAPAPNIPDPTSQTRPQDPNHNDLTPNPPAASSESKEAGTQGPSTNDTHRAPPPLIREATAPAIGPATEVSPQHPMDPNAEGPALFITLLLTTGARHPFKLDRKYLRKRGVEAQDDNPVNMSLYMLKELILRDWRDEWDAKPSSPDPIRLILMGKLLSDKSRLSDLGFKENAAPAIVHMSIKPQDLIDEEEANKNVRAGDGVERTPRCRCLIM